MCLVLVWANSIEFEHVHTSRSCIRPHIATTSSTAAMTTMFATTTTTVPSVAFARSSRRVGGAARSARAGRGWCERRCRGHDHVFDGTHRRRRRSVRAVVDDGVEGDDDDGEGLFVDDEEAIRAAVVRERLRRAREAMYAYDDETIRASRSGTSSSSSSVVLGLGFVGKVMGNEIVRRAVASIAMMAFIRAGLLLPSRFFEAPSGYDSPFSMRAMMNTLTGGVGAAVTAVLGDGGGASIGAAGVAANANMNVFADAVTGAGVPWFHVGIGPYVSASIMMSILTALIPELQVMNKDEMGRETLKWWSRLLTLLFAVVESVIEASRLQAFSLVGTGFSYYFYVVPMFVTGAMALAWVADEITDFGFGQGSGIIITMSICGGYFAALSKLVPKIIADFSLAAALPPVIFLSALMIGTVLLEQGTVKVPLEYFQGPKSTAANTTRRALAAASASTSTTNGEHIPFKINPTNMQPVIFTMFLTQFLQFIPFGFSWCNGQSVPYFIFFFCAVFLGTYIDLQNTPQDISEYLMKTGARVPGVRPGEMTITYFQRIQQGARFNGGFLLAVIATTCSVADLWMVRASGYSFGLTSMLIVVSTVIAVKRQIQAMLQMPKIDRVLRSM